jgi:ligand-binding SRPBCC domain-containing protein
VDDLSVAGRRPARLRLPEHHPELPEPTPAWIPQVVWPNTIWRSSSTAPPDIEAAAQAMALAKMGDVRSWTVIALDLGLPKDMSTPVTRYWRHIVSQRPMGGSARLTDRVARTPPARSAAH